MECPEPSLSKAFGKGSGCTRLQVKGKLKLVKGLLEESSERALQIKICQMVLAEQYKFNTSYNLLFTHKLDVCLSLVETCSFAVAV